MKNEWKRWFIDGSDYAGDFGTYDWEDRRYLYLNIHKDKVPFHEELKEHILKEYDADLLLGILEINSEMILDRFEDLLMKNMEKFEDE